MNVGNVGVEERVEWDNFAAAQPTFELMQSWGWGDFKQRMGWKVHRIAVREQGHIAACAQMLIKPLPVGNIAYVPRGPLCDWTNLDACRTLIDELHRIARKSGAVFLKVEPAIAKTEENQARLDDLGFQSSENTNQPRNTIVMDIQQDDETLLKKMRKKTRQYIRKAEHEGLTIRTADYDDLPAFSNLVEKTGKREKISFRGLNYFQSEWDTFGKMDQMVIHLAYFDGRLVGARTVHRFGEHAAEFHAGFSENGVNVHANYLLVWEAIKWARSRGCKTYDLWGIPDNIGSSFEEDEQTFTSNTAGLWGVYRFKSGFCSNVISYVGAYDYIYRPIPYRILINRLGNRDTFEKIAVWLESRRRT